MDVIAHGKPGADLAPRLGRGVEQMQAQRIIDATRARAARTAACTGVGLRLTIRGRGYNRVDGSRCAARASAASLSRMYFTNTRTSSASNCTPEASSSRATASSMVSALR